MVSSHARSSYVFFLASSIVLCALVSLLSVKRRVTVEAANRTVGVAIEVDAVAPLAAAQGVSFGRALLDLKARGATHLAVSEDTVSTLIAEGRLLFSSDARGVRFRGLDAATMDRIRRVVAFRFPLASAETSMSVDPRENALTVKGVPPLLLRTLPIGLPPDETVAARRAGLGLVARAGNPSGLTEGAVRGTIDAISKAGASFFLPSGDSVLGRRDLVTTFSDALREREIMYLSPEFARIAGDADVVEADPDRVVRLHTAQSAELDKLGLPGSVDRYVRAARERNERMLLLRPVTGAADKPLDAFGDLVGGVRDGLRRGGMTVGVPVPFSDPGLQRLFFPILGWLGAAVAGIVLWSLVGDRRVRTAGAVLLALLGAAAYSKTGAQIMALVASGAFPVAGFLLVEKSRLGVRAPAWVAALAGYLVISAVSVAGGLYVAGMLNGLPYLVKADEFRGIKISVFLPVVVVGLTFLSRLTDLKATLRSPILWRTAVIGVFLIALVGVMLSRTGNDGPVGASGGELALRGSLEKILSVRPRTKEFMVGHPALLAGLALVAVRFRRRRPGDPLAGWAVLLLALGAVGQTSVVNTLCHLHIPVGLSLQRIVLGIVLGAITGVPLAIAVARWATPRTPSPQDSDPEPDVA